MRATGNKWRAVVLTITAVLCMSLSTFGTGYADAAAAHAANAGPFIPPGAKPDLVAFIRNGYKPVMMPVSQMTPSSTGFPTEVSPLETIPGCLQPPKNYDSLTLTPEQMKAYGIAPRTPVSR
ncbi:MAG TPA: hypothetical protein VFQ25_02565 [Ktedonobacterales bacterium]|nr:hypothetical protein [Ktedonobacterales bacterium]